MRGGRLRARHRRRFFQWGRLCDAVRALNWLYCPEFLEHLWPSSPSSPQARVLHQLHLSVLQACRRGVYPDPRAAQEGNIPPPPTYYATPSSSSNVPLYADRVSLPPVGSGASADMMSLLPPHLAELFSSPDHLVQMPSPAELRAIPAYMGVASGEYAPFCQRLAERNMCLFRDRPPLVTNGLFAVPKDLDAQRFIVDMRPGNACFKPPESVLLANPGVISELHLPPGATLYVATADADNMYHRLRPPAWLQDFMGLPPVDSVSVGLPGPPRAVYPVLTSCPMGFSWAVLLAQSIHERLLDQLPDHGPLHRIAPGGPTVLGPAEHLAYIDDYSAIGTDLQTVNRHHVAAKAALASGGLPPKPSKSHPALPATADSQPAESLGMEFHHSGSVRPLTSNTRALILHTQAMLHRNSATGKQMERLLGSWTWNSLLRRPVLSVFSAVYAFARRHREHRRPRPLPVRVRDELQAALGLVPLLHADLSAPFSDRVYATDASNWGAGVCYARATDCWSPDVAIRAGAARVGEVGPIITAVPRLDWRTAVSSAWGPTTRHINRLEGQAAVMGLRHAARSARLWGTRITFLLDSSVMVGALRKGRSSSWELNRVCRRSAALQFATGLRPLWTWCPTAVNPADRPSRRRRHVS